MKLSEQVLAKQSPLHDMLRLISWAMSLKKNDMLDMKNTNNMDPRGMQGRVSCNIASQRVLPIDPHLLLP